MARTLVIGLGNPILGDDGVGWKVAEAVQRLLADAPPSALSSLASNVDVECCALGGLSLMERMVGYDHAIVVDAVATRQPPGTVSHLHLDELPAESGVHLTAVHDTSLQNALKLGRAMGARLPQTVMVIGVEAERLYEFSEELTPAVAAAVPIAARLVIESLGRQPVEERPYGVP